jgi:hypothetical protein
MTMLATVAAHAVQDVVVLDPAPQRLTRTCAIIGLMLTRGSAPELGSSTISNVPKHTRASGPPPNASVAC